MNIDPKAIGEIFATVMVDYEEFHPIKEAFCKYAGISEKDKEKEKEKIAQTIWDNPIARIIAGSLLGGVGTYALNRLLNPDPERARDISLPLLAMLLGGFGGYISPVLMRGYPNVVVAPNFVNALGNIPAPTSEEREPTSPLFSLILGSSQKPQVLQDLMEIPGLYAHKGNIPGFEEQFPKVPEPLSGEELFSYRVTPEEVTEMLKQHYPVPESSQPTPQVIYKYPPPTRLRLGNFKFEYNPATGKIVTNLGHTGHIEIDRDALKDISKTLASYFKKIEK